MPTEPTRRSVLGGLGAGLVQTLFRAQLGAAGSLAVRTGKPGKLDFRIEAISQKILHISIAPVHAEPPIREIGVLDSTHEISLNARKDLPLSVPWGRYTIRINDDPLRFTVVADRERELQEIQFDTDSTSVRFRLGNRPLFGLGEGLTGDRRGTKDGMRNGQSSPELRTTGSRVPIPWLISPEGWGIFVGLPLGTFDLTRETGVVSSPVATSTRNVYLVLGDSPAEVLLGYAELTGFPHLPPLWSLGYLQSHRTLASREEVLGEARTFREKKLPCDALIYLGTGFCPSGWNTGHGSFTFNASVFPDPGPMIEELAQDNFKVVLHVVNPPKGLHGRASDTGSAADDETDAARYWQKHLSVFRLGVGGWWPDEGDALGPIECLVRNRMYWEGPQLERPAERPYALHRNGYAGLQRYGWLWSGDIDSTWGVLRAQLAVGINTGLSGIHLWGTDTGGFVTTPELTGELYARWFQFSAFCPLFRSHGRTWKLRLPWQWNTGEYGPTELNSYHGKAGLPDPKELHNPEIEPVCRKYLDLRWRLMPYTYSVVRESHDTGLPIMRALWLHYPDDSQAIERSDEYMWGRDILVAPVTEKGATEREVYLPPGLWRDFWTEKEVEGGGAVSRAVDLATLPLYVRAGSILPTGPVRQYAAETHHEPLQFTAYPGADGAIDLYEDDGVSFEHERGQFTRLRAHWSNSD